MADMEQEICDACDLTGTSEESGIAFDESNDKRPPFHRHYTLPILRYRNLVLLILFVDGVSTTALWLAGGHSEYLVDSIRDFHILHSVFDSVLITAVKVVLLWLLFTWLEDVTLSNLQAPYHTQLKRKKTIIHTLIFTTSAICLVYFVIKGSLILNEYIKNGAYEPMHITYSVVTVSTVCFSAIQVALSLLSVSAMRRLRVYRVLHRYNDDGDEVDETGKVIPREATLKRVIALAKPELGIILAGIVFLFISSASTTASPFFFGLVIDAAVQSMDKLNKTVIYLCVIYAVTSVATFLRSYLFTLAGQRFVARLRKQLFASIIKQDIAFFDETRTGELTNRLSSDTTVIQNAVTVNISMLARYILEIIGSLVVMFILNPALTGVLLAVVPIISVAAVQYGAFLKKLQQKFQDCLATASATAEENISSIRTVRSFYGERKANVDYGDNIDQSYAIGKKLAFIQGAFSGVLGVLANGAIALLLWYGGKLLNEKVLTVGIITSFLLYTLQVAMAFAFLSSLYGDFMKAVGASVRIFELLDKKPVVGGEKNLTSPTDFDRSIAFHSVRFTYPSRPESQVLKDVSFSVASGQMIALVGPSGGGKSTIVSLIERFYDPESGSITLGGHELSTLSQEYFRQRVAMVAQEPVLFACSIKQNITYGKPASMEEVIEVAKQANAHDFIMSFDDQYDTVVGEKGVRLSGGQKQRIAIARALMVDPTILLLDEATSALDAESEHLVQQAIDNAMQNRTVLVIAHRLSTVRNAHKVIVINKGTIVEQGTHSELISMDGVYKKLVLRQLEAAKNTDLIDFS